VTCRGAHGGHQRGASARGVVQLLCCCFAGRPVVGVLSISQLWMPRIDRIRDATGLNRFQQRRKSRGRAMVRGSMCGWRPLMPEKRITVSEYRHVPVAVVKSLHPVLETGLVNHILVDPRAGPRRVDSCPRNKSVRHAASNGQVTLRVARIIRCRPPRPQETALPGKAQPRDQVNRRPQPVP